jgi:hypothetical protein
MHVVAKPSSQTENVIVIPTVGDVSEPEDGGCHCDGEGGKTEQNATRSPPVEAEREQGDGQNSLLGLEGADPEQRRNDGVESTRGEEGTKHEEEVKHVYAADIEAGLHDGITGGKEADSGDRREAAADLGVDESVKDAETAERGYDRD